MKNPRVLPDDVKVVLDAIRNDVLQLHGRWQAFNEIYANQEAVDLLNETAPQFFAFIYDAALTELIAAIARKTDKPRVAGKDTLSFQQLANLLKKNGFKMLSKRINLRVRKLLKNSDKDFVKRRDPLTFYRNNRGSHTNLQIRTNAAKPLPDLKVEKFENALKIFREMLDITNSAFGIDSVPYTDMSLDSGRLLTMLKAAKLITESPYFSDELANWLRTQGLRF